MTAPIHTRDEWNEVAAGSRPRTQAFIDGALVDAASGRTFRSINPATGEPIAEVAEGDAEDVDRAVRAARQAFERGTWSNAAPADRKRIVLRIAELIRANAEEFALLDSLDMGKPAQDALTIDVPGAAGVFGWYAEAADKHYDEIAPTGSDDLALVTRAGGGRCGRPMELPAGSRLVEGRARSRRRQHGRAEAGGAIAALGDPAR